MAKHTVKMVEQKEQNDQYVSFLYRCCGDESTDTWHTVALALPEAELEEVTKGFKTKIASQHEHKINFRSGSHPVNKHAAVEETITL